VTIELPDGMMLQPARPDDLDAVVALLRACEIAEFGEPETETSDIADGWRLLSPADDTRVVTADNGGLAGYAQVHIRNGVRFESDVFVRPEARGRGIGTALTRWVEERARAGGAARAADVRIGSGVSVTNEGAMALLAHEGYELARYFLRMSIEMREPPAAPVWPDGVGVRAMSDGLDERAVYEAGEEAFADHWDHETTSFEEWRARRIERSTYDPSLWFGAEDGGEIAGVTLCTDFPGLGWIDTVGVRRPWRRRGVAMALLQHAFAEFWSRGRTRVELGVDADSLTGATRLYERAGMRASRRYAIWQKGVSLKAAAPAG
jgi:mycothiol synthase